MRMTPSPWLRSTRGTSCNRLALREGTCDQTPFEVSRFPLSIRNWHFVRNTTQKSCLLTSEGGKTAGFCRQGKFTFHRFSSVDQGASGVEGSSHRDVLYLHDMWTTCVGLFGSKITSTISMACNFTTQSGGIWFFQDHEAREDPHIAHSINMTPQQFPELDRNPCTSRPALTRP